MAEPVSLDQAKTVAKNWLLERTGENRAFEAVAQWKASKRGRPAGIPDVDLALHVINLSPSGFVVVPTDTLAKPVICYSPSDTFSWNQIPPQLLALLYTASMDIVSQKEKEDIDRHVSHFIGDWNRLTILPFTPTSTRSRNRTVSPLLKTKWGQSQYFNESCPENQEFDYTIDDGHPPVGCVAVALAQIIKRNSYPLSGFGEREYEYLGVRNTVTFSQAEYLYSEMPNTLYTSDIGVADFLFHVSVGMVRILKIS